MEMTTMRKKSVSSLEKELREAQAHLKELRFRLSSGQLKNVRDVRETRKTIARLTTLLAEKSVQEHQSGKEQSN